MRAATLLVPLLFCAGAVRAGPAVRTGLAVSGLLCSNQDFRPYLGYEVDYLQDVGYPQYGPQLSVAWETRLLDFLTLRPELGFVQRGYHLNQIRLYNSSYKVRISYLELPVLLRAGLSRGRVRPGVLAGPYAALRLAATGRLLDQGLVATRPLSTVAPFDYGLVLGLDSEVAARRGQLVFELRFNLGLANVMRADPRFVELYADPDRVRVLSVGVMTGYRF